MKKFFIVNVLFVISFVALPLVSYADSANIGSAVDSQKNARNIYPKELITNGKSFVILSDEGTAVSEDFNHWSIDKNIYGDLGDAGEIHHLATNGKSYVRIINDAPEISKNALSWKQPKAKFKKISNVFTANGEFFLSSYNGGTIYKSKDGKNWTSSKFADCDGAKKAAFQCHIKSLFHFQSKYYAYVELIPEANVANEFEIVTSKDGIKWKVEERNVDADTANLLLHLTDISAGEEIIVAIDYRDMPGIGNHFSLQRSTDGINWTQDQSIHASNISYDGQRFYLNSEKELVSSDGLNWLPVNWVNENTALFGGFVVRNKAEYFYIGIQPIEPIQNVAARSQDGLSWQHAEIN